MVLKKVKQKNPTVLLKCTFTLYYGTYTLKF